MNGLQSLKLEARDGNNGGISAIPSQILASPTKARPGSSSSRKRTQDLAESPGSVENWEERDEGRVGVKRACNECRQQKV